MKNIKGYQEFITEEEGWKDKVIGGAMALGAINPFGKAMASELPTKEPIEISYEKGDDEIKKVVKKETTRSKTRVKSLLNQGWSLDSTVVDTLWTEVTKKAPETIVTYLEVKFDSDQYFKSGAYLLSPDVMSSIDSTLNEIYSEKGIITDVQIESSTDKQGLSTNLQKELISKGYSGDNKGLSKARCESLSNYIESTGVSDSLVSSTQKFEQGNIIDPSARYVVVKIVYIKSNTTVENKEVKELIPNVKSVYYLSKIEPERELRGGRPSLPKFKKIKKHIPIKDAKRKGGKTDCFF